MSDLHSGESRRITEMNTNDLEKLLREDALGQETDPEEVDALFEIMQELASRQEEAIDTEKAYASFKTHYAPRRNSEESMYAQTDGGSRGLRKILWPAAAAAVIAVGILIPGLLRWKPWSSFPAYRSPRIWPACGKSLSAIPASSIRKRCRSLF